eukprot:1158571-Pelagomonas_calceolata.AAC.5
MVFTNACSTKKKSMLHGIAVYHRAYALRTHALAFSKGSPPVTFVKNVQHKMFAPAAPRRYHAVV